MSYLEILGYDNLATDSGKDAIIEQLRSLLFSVENDQELKRVLHLYVNTIVQTRTIISSHDIYDDGR